MEASNRPSSIRSHTVIRTAEANLDQLTMAGGQSAMGHVTDGDEDGGSGCDKDNDDYDNEASHYKYTVVCKAEKDVNTDKF